MRLRSLLFAALLVPLSIPATAQERGQVGLVMGVPVSVGVIWHVSDALALRPAIDITHTSIDTDVSIVGASTSIESWRFAVGGSALWYFATADNVRPYVVPTFEYSHSSTDRNGDEFTPDTNRYSVGVAFGAQYTPVRKFGVFGEVGYAVTRSTLKITTPVGSLDDHTTAWGFTSVAGVIFYFSRQ